MEYKGRQIKDRKDVYESTEWRSYTNNIFSLDKGELTELLEEVNRKEAELESTFYGLNHNIHVDFYAEGGYEAYDGTEYDSEGRIEIAWCRPETDDERDIRIIREMTNIDKEIKEEEERLQRQILEKNSRIEKAKAILMWNGYTVTKTT